MSSRSACGITVWVCEPQSVSTDVRCFGAAGSETSKTFRPSHAPGVLLLGARVALHESSVISASVEVTRIPSLTVTSFWAPRHATCETSFGRSGSRTSKIRMPL